MSRPKEFKSFIFKSNIMDFAIGVIIGTAVVDLIKSLISDIVMPGLGLALGNVDLTDIYILLKQGVTPGPYITLADAQQAGAVTINIGKFTDTFFSFIAVSYVTFLFVKNVSKLKGDSDGKSVVKECPFCFSTIPSEAVRCPNCTSHLNMEQ